MAEEDTGQERTEQATPRRLERAREEGQVPRSREPVSYTHLTLPTDLHCVDLGGRRIIKKKKHYHH